MNPEPRYNFTEKLPELLAPAGSFLCLKAAVQNGADAVYLGLKTGNARIGAENFTLDELREAVEYAHIRGVRVYLALNTMVYEEELSQACDTAFRAAEAGVDAVILQDPGLASLLTELPCERHASTQMSIYNPEGLRLLKQSGFDRCITARELSVSEIAALCAENLMDIEVFCHGALCMSLSGQCLLSSFIGGRSGNRGTCAQPCRKKYALIGESSQKPPAYRLSPSDFAALPHIESLVKAGVRSLKIEGRLKSPSYVAAVTRYYREAIDGTLTDCPGKMRDLQLLFGRGDFTSGYLFGKLPFSDITFRSAGRVGLPVGTLTTTPKRLPSPQKLPRNLTRFCFTVKFKKNTPALKVGDGVTIYAEQADGERKSIGGGTINTIRRSADNHSAEITVVGSIRSSGNTSYLLALTDDPALRADLESDLTDSERRKVPVFLKFIARIGQKPFLTMADAEGHLCRAEGTALVEKAISVPTAESEIRQRLAKLGDTPFTAAETEIDADESVFLPASVLNGMRRDCCTRLGALRAVRQQNTSRSHGDAPPVFTPKPAPGGISLFFYRGDTFLAFEEAMLPNVLHPYRDNLRTYYFPLSLLWENGGAAFSRVIAKAAALKRSAGNDCKLAAYFPHILLGEALIKVRHELPAIMHSIADGILEIDGFLCQNPGDLTLLQELGSFPLICCDHSFNVANSAALHRLAQLGVNRATLTPEAASDLQALLAASATAEINPEIMVGGRIVLMRSRHCYIDEDECGGKKGKFQMDHYSLTDEHGGTYPILPQRDDCCSILLSHKPLSLTPAEIKKIRSICPEVTLRFNLL